jgi:hypothetical protein
MIQFLAIAGVAAALITPGTDPALAPSEKITLDVVTVNGSGCPAGTTAVAVAPDNTAFTVTYSDYLAQVGAGAQPTDKRKNCQLAVQVNIPSGFTFAIAQADYRGYAYLAKGATGMQRASYYFQGMSATQAATHRLPAGPLDDNWQATDEAVVAEMVYAPCGEKRYLNINTELRVAAGTSDPDATSYVTMDSTDAAASTVYHLSWKRC